MTTSYQYDALGRLVRVYDPTLTGAINYIQYTYNDDDQVTQVSTPTGNVTYQYDPTTHWLTSTTDLNGDTTQYAYDPTTGNLTSVTQLSSAGNQTTQYVYDRLGNLVLLISPSGNRTAFNHDVLGDTTGIIASDNLAPTATVSSQITSPTTVTVSLSASEPIVVASITYWVDGQPQSSGTTDSVRLTDATSFSFDLTGLTATKLYDYQITLTDAVGLEQTLPPGTLAGDKIPPTVTATTPSSGATSVALTTTIKATFSEAIQAGSISFVVKDSSGITVVGTVAYSASTNTATFTPNAPLTEAMTYTVAVSGAKDLAGNTMTSPDSWSFTALVVASRLVATAQPPTGVTAGAIFGLSITAEDGQGHVATTFAGSVTLALATNPGGGTLGGTLVVTPNNGVATFSNLTLNKSGTGYTFTATNPNLSAVTTSAPQYYGGGAHAVDRHHRAARQRYRRQPVRAQGHG